MTSRAGSSRWCPTPEQVMILKELYRAGVRSPRASQIHKITAHLSLYGKVEGRNVFYWFQNHKARDKQKLVMKKKFTEQPPLHQHQQQLCQRHTSPNCCSCDSSLNRHQSPPDSASSAFPQLGYHNSSLPPHPPHPPPPPPPLRSLSYLLREANIDGGGSRPITECNCHRRSMAGDDPQKVEMEKSTTKMYNGIWMMVMDIVASSSELPPARPLKTLQLFPTEASADPRQDRETGPYSFV
ncbi:hypothetical protein SAY87_013193 [Trapa incisa]|uniref:Homeobox domain-containing protein n=1 Tax=Trapa incisa TaxID=236973 RepID=A0AAN7KAM4_9MYRT|nr:hypothetical protein SAY87_013193 [Trapa incisa]